MNGLRAAGLECVRGERQLFRGLDLEVSPGACVHIAGPNGAGKTSLLRILAGLLAPTAGTVHWRGRPLERSREEFGAALAFVGHLNGVKDELTVLENVCFERALRGADSAETAALRDLESMGLRACADQPARTLSQGQKRRVALVRLCGSAPAPLWILDEPFNALDAGAVESLHARIAAHMAVGGMVVLTAHQEVRLPPGARRVALGAASDAPAGALQEDA